MNFEREDPTSVARHEAGHAVLAHAFGWNVVQCQVSPEAWTEVEQPTDFRACASVWEFIVAGPDTVIELATPAREAISTNMQRPLVMGMLFLIVGELHEHDAFGKFVDQLYDESRFESQMHADASKLRVLEEAWKATTQGALRDPIVGGAERLRLLAKPLVQQVCARLLSDGSIANPGLVDIFGKFGAEAQALQQGLAEIVDKHAGPRQQE